MRLAAALAVALLAGGMARAQTALGIVRFEFERAGMAAPHWWMVVSASGDGSYEAAASSDTAAVKQPIHVSAETLKRMMAGAAQAATKSCETKIKNVANTGKKTITYLDASGQTVGACSYNLPDDAGLRDATEAFLAIEETLQAGQRLAFKRRFDRLGLDTEMDTLMAMVKDGRAIEVGNIAPVLQSLVEDADVMQRVRTKAAELLKQAQKEK